MAASVQSRAITAQNQFTTHVNTGGETRIAVGAFGTSTSSEVFTGTTVTVEARMSHDIGAGNLWAAVWVKIGEIVSDDPDGAVKLIEVGSNIDVRAGVRTGDFSAGVTVTLAV